MSDQECKKYRTAPIRSLAELRSCKFLTNRSSLKPVGKRCFAASKPGGNFKDSLSKNVPKTLVCHDMMGETTNFPFFKNCWWKPVTIDLYIYFTIRWLS